MLLRFFAVTKYYSYFCTTIDNTKQDVYCFLGATAINPCDYSLCKFKTFKIHTIC